MAFDISLLSNYVALNSKAIATKAIANATTAKLLIDNSALQSGVKGSAAILKMGTDVTFQDGSSCGRTGVGNVKLSDKSITVKKIKDTQDICPPDLDNHYYSFFAMKGASPENGFEQAFVQQIMDNRAAGIAAVNEQLLWVGDTSLTGSTNLNYINGIVKQITGATYVNLSASTTGSTIVDKLQNAFLAMPVQERTQSDFRIFVGEDVYAQYTIALANKNIYKLVDDFKLFGTTATIQPTPGLNGTNDVVMTRISNLQLGVDGLDDSDKAVLRYSMETEKWYMDFHWAIGVSVIFPEVVGFAKIA